MVLKRALFLLLAVSLVGANGYKNYIKDGKQLEQQGMYQQAVKLYKKAVKDPQIPKKEKFDILLDIADISLDKLNQPDSALQYVLEAHSLFSDNYSKMDEVYYRLGVIYETLEKYVDAAKSYEKVATRYRNSKYYEDALNGVERCFKKNFKEYVAIVNGKPITKLEFDEQLEQIPPFARKRYETPEGKKQLLNMLIERRLMVEEAEAQKLYLKSDVIKQLEQARARILQKALYNEEVKKKVKVTDDEVEKYYNEHKDEFKVPGKATVRRIVVKDKNLAHKILQELKKGASFDSLARKYSITPDAKKGGLLMGITSQARPKELAKWAFNLKVGETSRVIPLRDGNYMILKVEKRQPPRVKNLKEVRLLIVNKLKRQKERDLWEKFRKELFKKHNVKILLSDSTGVNAKQKG